MAPTSTRRGKLTSAIAVALVTVLGFAGCSPSPNAESQDPATVADGPGPLPAAEGKTDYPLTLTTPWGETVLEERPLRIAAVDQAGMVRELLAALEVPAVVAPVTPGIVWVNDPYPGIELYQRPSDTAYPVELIAAENPDLIVIIGGWDPSDSYDQLAAIAPVLAGETEEEFGASWESKIKIIGQTLDLADAADAVIAQQEQFFADVRAENPEFQGKTAIFAVYYGEQSTGLNYLSRSGSDPERLLVGLGFSENPTAGDFADDTAVSVEMMSKLETDLLLLATVGGELTELTSLELYQNLEVVAGERVAIFDNTGTGYVFAGEEHEGNLVAAIAWGTPLAARWAAERLVPIIHGVLAE